MSRDDDTTPRSPRKAYHPPTFIVYGDVRDPTLEYGIGKPDNGVSHSHSKKHPNRS